MNTSFFATRFACCSFQFLRKGLLILLLTFLRDEKPVLQALLSLIVNGTFLLLLRTQPFVYFSSSLLGMNLYQMAEVSSCLTCLIGNALGLVGALKISYVNTLGCALAVMNFTYFVLFVYAYGTEMKRASGLAVARSERNGREKLVKAKLGVEVKEALGEWNHLMASLAEDSPERCQKLKDEMVSGGMQHSSRHVISLLTRAKPSQPLVKSRIVAAIGSMLMKTEANKNTRAKHGIHESFNAKSFKKKCRRFQRVLNEVNADFQEEVEAVAGASTLLEIATRDNLTFVCTILEGGIEEGGNPLHLEMTPVNKSSNIKSPRSSTKMRQKAKTRASKSVGRGTSPPPPPPPLPIP